MTKQPRKLLDRVCAHCAAKWTPASPTAAQGGWDAHAVYDLEVDAPQMFDTCSSGCRKAMGLRERY